MIQIDDPPTVTACASCPAPLTWLYSARRNAWVSFIPVDDLTLRVHGCRQLQEPRVWRNLQHGTPPNDTYIEAKQQLQDHRLGES